MAWRIPFIRRKPSGTQRADIREATRDVHARIDALREEVQHEKDRTDERPEERERRTTD
ncbi:MAG: hypothetical protein ACYDEB_10165 [Dehalococcoidia bacterium]